MHYYQFNIGDYSSHTSRLNLYEDLAYRRLLDLYYLNERPFNGCSTDVAREIGMLDSLGDVEYVLNKFFTEKNNEWHNKRCDREIKVYQAKQKTAKKAGVASGIARKKKGTTVERPLNGKGTDVEPNINHKPLTIKQEPKIKTRASPFVKPDISDVSKYCNERDNNVDPIDFMNHYEANGWVRGKTKIKDWKACVRTWEKRNGSNGQGQNTGFDQRSRAKKVSDKLREIGERDIEQNGFTDSLGNRIV